ncbi:hypothetical protein CJ030_MR2G027634 [Morella rubra]|uniref:Myb/SANT-like domain-containing protein n=1 Tax=Morella rubra TaxID=262757 RepID=A0A6A1WFR9_9ROSI|nr:hypothetical protein CJ030_MR2G027634 [Morella rubra]
MKGQYRELYDLLHHDMGFGWDPVSNTVEGSAKQWQTYLLAHPNAKPFRRKGLTNYEIMGFVFDKTTTTGLLQHACTKSLTNTYDERDLEDTLNNLNISVTLLVVPKQKENMMGQHIPQPYTTSVQSGKHASDGSCQRDAQEMSKGCK